MYSSRGCSRPCSFSVLVSLSDATRITPQRPRDEQAQQDTISFKKWWDRPPGENTMRGAVSKPHPSKYIAVYSLREKYLLLLLHLSPLPLFGSSHGQTVSDTAHYRQSHRKHGNTEGTTPPCFALMGSTVQWNRKVVYAKTVKDVGDETMQ
jgi:hypothetical protein